MVKEVLCIADELYACTKSHHITVLPLPLEKLKISALKTAVHSSHDINVWDYPLGTSGQ